MVDSFVKKYSLDLENRMTANSVAKYTANMGFTVVKIIDGQNNEFIGQVRLTNRLDLTSEKTKGTIYIEMEGLFAGPKSLGKEEFEKKLKVEGATMLNHSARAYIIANTALSNMPTISTPIIDYDNFFDSIDKKKNFKLITNDNKNKESDEEE